MKCSEIIEILEKLAPPSMACDWDNPGLIAGRSDKEVKKIVIALDATDDAVETAIREKADLLLTHHPLIFKAVKKVNDQNFITRRIVKLIQNDISYYAMHTNFDSAPGCMADLAAERLELKEAVPLETMGTVSTEKGEVAYGIGKAGLLPVKMTVKEAAEFVKMRFGLEFLTVYGLDEVTEQVSTIAVCPGSGGDMVDLSIEKGAGVLITGDVSHHEGIDAAARGLAVIDAGHYGLEHIFIDFMEGYLKDHLGEEIVIYKMPVHFPVKYLAGKTL